MRLIEIRVDIGHFLIKLRLIELAVEILSGDRLVGGVSFDRLNVSGPGLLDLAVIERQLVLERHLDRVVEIGIECRLGRRLDCRGGAVARIGLVMAGPEAVIQRGCHFLVDGKIFLKRRNLVLKRRDFVLKRRDFQGARDRLVEIIVEVNVGGRLRRAGRGKVGVIGRVVKDEVLLERSGKLVVGESGGGGVVSRLVLDRLLRDRRAFLGNVEFAHQLLFEVDVEICVFRSLVCRRSLRDRRRLRPDRLTRVETHDPGQFRERIVVSDVVVFGYFQLGSVCHYCSQTRTQSDAMDVAQGWPYQRNVGKR
ncbi:hypothetical protein [Mesorhizobium sp. WSM4904]|uniref:hypothetical protein n=1 Tax=Mesorhizobium sp. WSM4904 TaxID=3038545 RepID=UPI002418900A|nr:hypothetical protein [Mesorhizobium sp. WSM4904]WFP60440.1 hypothetical protein QAZ47_18155 [Mesorhizobium sp. WSM4904]